jgi:hypothetical protein
VNRSPSQEQNLSAGTLNRSSSQEQGALAGGSLERAASQERGLGLSEHTSRVGVSSEPDLVRQLAAEQTAIPALSTASTTSTASGEGIKPATTALPAATSAAITEQAHFVQPTSIDSRQGSIPAEKEVTQTTVAKPLSNMGSGAAGTMSMERPMMEEEEFSNEEIVIAPNPTPEEAWLTYAPREGLPLMEGRRREQFVEIATPAEVFEAQGKGLARSRVSRTKRAKQAGFAAPSVNLQGAKQATANVAGNVAAGAQTVLGKTAAVTQTVASSVATGAVNLANSTQTFVAAHQNEIQAARQKTAAVASQAASTIKAKGEEYHVMERLEVGLLRTAEYGMLAVEKAAAKMKQLASRANAPAAGFAAGAQAQGGAVGLASVQPSVGIESVQPEFLSQGPHVPPEQAFLAAPEVTFPESDFVSSSAQTAWSQAAYVPPQSSGLAAGNLQSTSPIAMPAPLPEAAPSVFSSAGTGATSGFLDAYSSFPQKEAGTAFPQMESMSAMQAGIRGEALPSTLDTKPHGDAFFDASEGESAGMTSFPASRQLKGPSVFDTAQPMPGSYLPVKVVTPSTTTQATRSVSHAVSGAVESAKATTTEAAAKASDMAHTASVKVQETAANLKQSATQKAHDVKVSMQENAEKISVTVRQRAWGLAQTAAVKAHQLANQARAAVARGVVEGADMLQNKAHEARNKAENMEIKVRTDNIGSSPSLLAGGEASISGSASTQLPAAAEKVKETVKQGAEAVKETVKEGAEVVKDTAKAGAEKLSNATTASPSLPTQNRVITEQSATTSVPLSSEKQTEDFKESAAVTYDNTLDSAKDKVDYAADATKSTIDTVADKTKAAVDYTRDKTKRGLEKSKIGGASGQGRAH